jgi:hypothetical protein
MQMIFTATRLDSNVVKVKITLLTVIALLTSILLFGCSLFVTEEFFGKSWKGHSIVELEEAWGEPAEVIENLDGTKEVRYELFHGKCTYYFITDSADNITGYRYRSSGWGACKPIG